MSGIDLKINMKTSINYGSFIVQRIVGVKKDITDKTLTIPTNVIVPMNADSEPLGSDITVMWYEYLGERLTSGVYYSLVG